MAIPVDQPTQLQLRPFNDDVKALYAKHKACHVGDAGIDLFCIADQTIPAHSRSNVVHLGISTAMIIWSNGITTCNGITSYYSATHELSYRLCMRSSAALNTPLRLANNEGIIDSGYRGEICAIFDNPFDEKYTIKKGDRLVQIVGPSLQKLTLKVVDKLSDSSRGTGGLGSTGY